MNRKKTEEDTKMDGLFMRDVMLAKAYEQTAILCPDVFDRELQERMLSNPAFLEIHEQMGIEFTKYVWNQLQLPKLLPNYSNRALVKIDPSFGCWSLGFPADRIINKMPDLLKCILSSYVYIDETPRICWVYSDCSAVSNLVFDSAKTIIRFNSVI